MVKEFFKSKDLPSYVFFKKKLHLKDLCCSGIKPKYLGLKGEIQENVFIGAFCPQYCHDGTKKQQQVRFLKNLV